MVLVGAVSALDIGNDALVDETLKPHDLKLETPFALASYGGRFVDRHLDFLPDCLARL